MRRLSAILLALVFVAGCSGSPTTDAQAGKPKDGENPFAWLMNKREKSVEENLAEETKDKPVEEKGTRRRSTRKTNSRNSSST
jgi:PBP1b-binding outer membrane lipoprotein LpoB